MEPGRMILSWGDPPATPTTLAPQPLMKRDTLPPESAEPELRVLRELIHALKQDADRRDDRFEARLDRLQAYLQALQSQADQRWSTTEQDMNALYLLARKGDRP